MDVFKELGRSGTDIINVAKQMQNVLCDGTSGLTDFHLSLL